MIGSCSRVAQMPHKVRAQQALQTANVQAAKVSVAAIEANVEQNTRDLTRHQVLFRTGSSIAEAAERLITTQAQLSAQLQRLSVRLERPNRSCGVSHEGDIEEETEGFFSMDRPEIFPPLCRSSRVGDVMFTLPFQCPPWFPPRSNRPAGVSGDLALGRLKCTSVMEIDR
jgi:hypothetical protein